MSECSKAFSNKLNWVQDEHDANHYVCLKCGCDRWVHSSSGSLAEVLLQIFAGLLLIILLRDRSPFSFENSNNSVAN